MQQVCDWLRAAVMGSPGDGRPTDTCRITIQNNRKAFVSVFTRYNSINAFKIFQYYLSSQTGFREFVELANILCGSAVKLMDMNKYVYISRLATTSKHACLANIYI
jgi:hypothetical protein